MSSLKHIVKLLLIVATASTVLSTSSMSFAGPVPAGTDDQIRARLAPFGSLCRAGDECGATTAVVEEEGPSSGSAIYDQFCFACHATGASEAPLFADVEAWAPRIAKGMETMMASTLNGLGMMPPKGTCMACSDEELQAAVDYMLEEAR